MSYSNSWQNLEAALLLHASRPALDLSLTGTPSRGSEVLREDLLHGATATRNASTRVPAAARLLGLATAVIATRTIMAVTVIMVTTISTTTTTTIITATGMEVPLLPERLLGTKLPQLHPELSPTEDIQADIQAFRRWVPLLDLARRQRLLLTT